MLVEELKRELGRIEAEVEKGNRDLKALGFWRAVHLVKKSPQRSEFAEQVARIESRASGEEIRFKLSLRLGNAMEIAATLLGAVLLLAGAASADLIFKSAGIVLASLMLSFSVHPLAHYLVGSRYGIRFLYYYPDGPALIEPTLKIDYASYIRAAPEQRALMHVSGAVVTVSASFLCMLVGIAADVAPWAKWFLAAYFMLMLGSDLLLSPRMGDLKRYMREKKYAEA